jgi:hypothetical protein
MASNKRKRTKSSVRKFSKSKSKPFARAKAPKKKKTPPKPKSRQSVKRGRANAGELTAFEQYGRGPHSAGQSGDTQGLAADSLVDTESVKELLEEGQSFEAEVLDGVENALDPDQAEVYTREVIQDDVPDEYHEKD